MATSAQDAAPVKRKRGRPSEAELRALAGFPDDDKPAKIGSHGGKRPGAGRRPRVTDTADEVDDGDPYEIYNKAKAKKMAYDADIAELKYRQESGEYIPRDEVRQASATAFAAIAQTLRSIPDNLERRLGLSPEVAEEIGIMIDAAMSELSVELERMTETAH